MDILGMAADQLQYKPIAVVGRPGVGKTATLGSLSRALCIPTCEEVGRICRRRWGVPSDRDVQFDYYVMLNEFANDVLLGDMYPARHVLVEQWHFGNLAHAKTRSEHAYEAYLLAITQYCDVHQHPCIWLMTRNRERESEWEAAFEEVIDRLELSPTIVTMHSVTQAAECVTSLLIDSGQVKR